MSRRTLLAAYGLTGLGVGLPFAFLHMRAAPNASISPLQHVAAAVANYFGPWGVVVVRLVDFPNAGLRSFSWELAVGLTVIGAALVALGMRSSRRRVQVLLVGLWVVFLVVWFGLGFTQIASGLL